MKNIGLKIAALIIGLVILVMLIIALWVMTTYNSFVSLKADVDNGWAQVETQYQRRADLVPQLVSVVEGAADFEKSVLTEVTEARTQWLNTTNDTASTMEENIAASNTFDSAFSKLLVTVESYPTLTATETFVTLQSQLEGTENRIAVSRKDYNDAATEYNVTIQLIPARVVAGLFGFTRVALFEAEQGAEQAPEIEFEF